ncbi:MAG TPA: hypothetical protein PKE38_04970 [Ignavibacteriaceae bacterium]|nr:hypothetical protein [Ignavibacteriaceae bacterium]
MEIEICNECGRDVKFGTGLFINRVIDFNDIDIRIEMGKLFPEGDFICINCDSKLEEKKNNVGN